MNKLQNKYAEVLQSLDRANREVIRLTQDKKLLEEAGAGSQEPVKEVKTRQKRGPRPPRGHVEKSILGVLTPEGLSVNGVKSALEAAKYGYTLHYNQLAKALTRFVSEGKILKNKTPAGVVYVKA